MMRYFHASELHRGYSPTMKPLKVYVAYREDRIIYRSLERSDVVKKLMRHGSATVDTYVIHHYRGIQISGN